MTSSVRNVEPRAREVFLTVVLPETAFISRFAIEVEGQLFVAYVREKEAAWREYQQAVTRGRTAGVRQGSLNFPTPPYAGVTL